MGDPLDESVSNGVTVDDAAEEGASTGAGSDETGHEVEEASGQWEAVGDFAPPTPPSESSGGAETAEFGAESAEVDPTLSHFYVDIGNASFGFGPETVHGVDDRVRIDQTANYPWRVHCSLLITAADNSNWIGTGWFISPNVLITAGHVVFITGSAVPGQNGWVSRIRAIPGRNGTQKPYGEASSTTFYSVRGWTENANPEYDYGAIVLDAPLGNQTGWLGFGVYADTDLTSATANISGYPGDKPSGTQWYGARRIDSVGPRKVFYDVDTAGGQSGSAVYRIKDGSRYGVAVHAYGGAMVNSGTRINRAVYDNMKKWKDDHAA